MNLLLLPAVSNGGGVFMNIAQARQDAKSLAGQLRALSANEEDRTREEILARASDLADVADSIKAALSSSAEPAEDYVKEYPE